MASHGLISVSTLHLSRVVPPGNLPRNRSKSWNSSKGSHGQCSSISCTSVLHEKSAVQHRASTPVLPVPSIPIPVPASNQATGPCTRVLQLIVQNFLEAGRGLSTLFTVLILVNSFLDNPPPDINDTFKNVPQDLSGGDTKPRRIQRPKSAKAENCTQKCVGTCIRGGAGSPGEGPFNVRRPLVVFKEGFRSRQYCLVECSDICNLIGDGDSGP